jgi:RNA polymerase sigma-70 factor (ECF subfamily)
MRWVALARYKEKSRKKRIPSQLTLSLEELEDCISSGVLVEESYEAKEIGEMISNFVWSLNDRQRYLFMDRYYLAEPVEKTAADLSISVQTAYRELGKIKQSLKEYLERNGVRV